MVKQSGKNLKEKTLDLQYPQVLRTGDRVGLVCPASRPESLSKLKHSQHVIEEMGYVPVLGKHILKTDGATAGSDKERAEDLIDFYADESIKAIFCLSGGWGSLRLLDKLDYDQIAKANKILTGSGDNTSLLLAVHKMAKQVVFYAPNIESINDTYSFERFKKAVSSNQTPDAITVLNDSPLLKDPRPYAPVKGKSKGRLIGGNLTALASLLGTKFEPDFNNGILFLEEDGERIDTIDRWLTSLDLSSKLDEVKAITFSFYNCSNRGLVNALPLDELIGSKLIERKLPSCFGLALKSNGKCATLPLGLEVEFDAELGVLVF